MTTETLSSRSSVQTDAIDRASVMPAAMAALVLGAVLVFGVGVAQPDVLHNAAHDARHAMAFPCH